MKTHGWIRGLFFFAALYDGILGVWFLVAPGQPFRMFEVTPPNHMGYVQFPAALLLVFALIFFRIARDPVEHVGLIPYGVLLKVAYCGVTFFYWATTGIPWMWKPFALIDVVMGVAFVLAFFHIRGGR